MRGGWYDMIVRFGQHELTSFHRISIHTTTSHGITLLQPAIRAAVPGLDEDLILQPAIGRPSDCESFFNVSARIGCPTNPAFQYLTGVDLAEDARDGEWIEVGHCSAFGIGYSDVGFRLLVCRDPYRPYHGLMLGRRMQAA
jgi:hypothetical protein